MLATAIAYFDYATPGYMPMPPCRHWCDWPIRYGQIFIGPQPAYFRHTVYWWLPIDIDDIAEDTPHNITWCWLRWYYATIHMITPLPLSPLLRWYWYWDIISPFSLPSLPLAQYCWPLPPPDIDATHIDIDSWLMLPILLPIAVLASYCIDTCRYWPRYAFIHATFIAGHSHWLRWPLAIDWCHYTASR